MQTGAAGEGEGIGPLRRVLRCAAYGSVVQSTTLLVRYNDVAAWGRAHLESVRQWQPTGKIESDEVSGTKRETTMPL